MNRIIKILEYWYDPGICTDLNGLMCTKEEYQTLKYYFDLHLKKNPNNESNVKLYREALIRTVLNSSNIDVAVKDKEDCIEYWNNKMKDIKNEISFLKYNGEESIEEYRNIVYSLENLPLILRQNIFKTIELSMYDIQIEIISKIPNKIIKDKYERARTLYIKGNYEQAIMYARDIFQEDLEENLDGSIKKITKTNTTMDNHINQLIEAISKMRNDKINGIKTNEFKGMAKRQKQAIAKLAIEQILNIRNYLSILQLEE